MALKPGKGIDESAMVQKVNIAYHCKSMIKLSPLSVEKKDCAVKLQVISGYAAPFIINATNLQGVLAKVTPD